jgi:glycosyltransferase involved in cell wall biosynthesis
MTGTQDHGDGANSGPLDLVCFSHLRWNFVLQRPQHLLSRFARERRVFFSVHGPMRAPEDQAALPHPRLGYHGVVDERLDLSLLAAVADARPDWCFVIIGPVVKIDPASLPRRPNLHFLGARPYTRLPAYLSGWDVALMPFARNEATRFISPTKTPEYLAAGRPVVSTSIHDVVSPYGDLGLVRIADTPEDFVRACEATMTEDPSETRPRVDAFLAEMSWDETWSRMKALLDAAVERVPA